MSRSKSQDAVAVVRVTTLNRVLGTSTSLLALGILLVGIQSNIATGSLFIGVLIGASATSHSLAWLLAFGRRMTPYSGKQSV